MKYYGTIIKTLNISAKFLNSDDAKEIIYKKLKQLYYVIYFI